MSAAPAVTAATADGVNDAAPVPRSLLSVREKDLRMRSESEALDGSTPAATVPGPGGHASGKEEGMVRASAAVPAEEAAANAPAAAATTRRRFEPLPPSPTRLSSPPPPPRLPGSFGDSDGGSGTGNDDGACADSLLALPSTAAPPSGSPALTSVRCWPPRCWGGRQDLSCGVGINKSMQPERLLHT